MTTAEMMYTVLGLLTAWGVMVAVRGERMPQWQSKKFLELPEMVRTTRVRRARRAGILLAVLCVAVSIGYGAADRYLAKHHHGLDQTSER